MANLQNLLTEADALQRALEKHVREGERLRWFSDKATKAVRKAVRSGETTGDRIKDFILARDGAFHEADEKRYRAIDKALRGRKKELVLVTRRVGIDRGPMYHHSGSSGSGRMDIAPRMSSKETVIRFRCGVLKAEKLVVSLDQYPPRCELPVAKWITESTYSQGDFHDESSVLQVFGNATEYLVLDSTVDLVPDELFPFVSRVVVGDETVRSWLKENRHEHAEEIFKKCAELLGKLVLTPE